MLLSLISIIIKLKYKLKKFICDETNISFKNFKKNFKIKFLLNKIINIGKKVLKI